MPDETKNVKTAVDVMDQIGPGETNLITDAKATVGEILEYLSPDLYEQPELTGVTVQDGDKVVGIIPRDRLLALAGDFTVRKSVELAGVPQRRPHYFVCPEDPMHHRRLVIFYDPDDPPICPTHRVVLVEDD